MVFKFIYVGICSPQGPNTNSRAQRPSHRTRLHCEEQEGHADQVCNTQQTSGERGGFQAEGGPDHQGPVGEGGILRT